MLSASAPLSDWLTWLETLSPKEIDLGLERVQSVLSRLSLDLPDHVLLIAGTNGKGSSVAASAALLAAAGYPIGAYTSPHITDFNERIAVNGVPASDATITAALQHVEDARDDLPLTYFEFGTLAAMVVFAEAGLDVWILEVGMGGRLDATNVVAPTASLITNVSLDHCDWLGADIETIAAEKAGIMRAGVPTVFASADVPNSIQQQAGERGAVLLLAGRDFRYSVLGCGNWNWSGQDCALENLPAPGLRGAIQYENVAAVLALLEAAGLERALAEQNVVRVLPGLQLEGRMQTLEAGSTNWVLDVAHNPAAAARLAETLRNEPNVAERSGQRWAIIGLLDDKDVEGVALALDSSVDHWLAVTASSARAVPAEELARRVSNACGRPCRIFAGLSEAIQFAGRAATENDTVLVTGSFYLVGPALRELQLYSPPTS
ncbi:MAG: bifunctional folylpolyglutamate synthase/dihydrofolate synthase [Gammaproteobacteria bacterium]|nr:bifunctional folylpolyglutamate synthase/dihydrofolate synthase [Gammaproteobacteria bacterium]